MASRPDDGIDAVIEVQDKDGKLATLVVEAKRTAGGRDVGPRREQLDALAVRFPQGQGPVLARYLSPPVRALSTEAGLSYVDATGNMRIAIDSSGLFLSDSGADRDPWRGPGLHRGTLKGEPAANIVRAIADFAGRPPSAGLVHDPNNAPRRSPRHLGDFPPTILPRPRLLPAHSLHRFTGFRVASGSACLR